MAERQGENLVPLAGEVCHRSSYLKKLKKLPNKYRTSYKYHAINYRNIYKMGQETYINSHQELMLLTKM
jgi:hypothetical protein